MDPTKLPRLKTGDIVFLRSGGPALTVKKVMHHQIICNWYCHIIGEFKEATFVESQLISSERNES
jgi:uncharacterized protein YodC (DUF2158 family)